jgi:outer membrane protein assembly factor BamB
MKIVYILFTACFALWIGGVSTAEDWPTYRHDNRRSAVTSEKPDLPLKIAWVKKSSVAPMMAWSGPAKWDAYSGNKDLQSMRNFDPAFFVTAANDSVYYGSSVDNAAHCLDARTGSERWVSFAGGAVRLPPTIVDKKAYFGSDDGNVYCVEAESGKRIWKYRAASSRRLIPSNGKLISPWPVRSGVMVKDKVAYFAASLLPWEESYLCALDKEKGTPIYVSKNTGMTLQGALLGSSTTVYAPQGRSVPLLFDASSGKQKKGVSGMGGTFCLLTDDELLVGMPHNQKSSGNVIQIGDPAGTQAMLKFPGADRLLVVGEMAYLHQGRFLKSLNRVKYGRLQTSLVRLSAQIKPLKGKLSGLRKGEKALLTQKNSNGVAEIRLKISEAEKALKSTEAQIASSRKGLAGCFGWERECEVPYELIFAGGVLFIGGKEKVVAFDADTGKQLWVAEVEGHSYGLAYSGGRLYVSTSLGHIYCFSV